MVADIAIRRIREFGRALYLRRPIGGFDPRQAVRWEVRQGHVDGRTVKRLVVFLRGAGCEWITRGGGCTMCGFHRATNGRSPTRGEYIEQLRVARNQLGTQVFPIVCLYNDGSLLNPEETSTDAVLAMGREVASWPGATTLVIESRAEFVTKESITSLTAAIYPMNLQVAIGYESSNEDVRNIAINKGLSQDLFERAVEAILETGAAFRPLVLVKPPFLTEREAVDDCLETIQYLKTLNPIQIDLETMTVEDGTLVHALWHHGHYRPPRLWSLVEIVLRAKFDKVYVSPFTYSVEALDIPRNCGNCDDKVTVSLINHYNPSFDRGTIADLTCKCQHEIDEASNSHSIAERVVMTLDLIDKS